MTGIHYHRNVVHTLAVEHGWAVMLDGVGPDGWAEYLIRDGVRIEIHYGSDEMSRDTVRVIYHVGSDDLYDAGHLTDLLEGS